MLKKISGKNHFKISHFRNINPFVTCYMSLDGKKIKAFILCSSYQYPVHSLEGMNRLLRWPATTGVYP